MNAASHLGAKKKPLQLLTDLEKVIEMQLRVILTKIDPKVKSTAENKLKEIKKAENMEKDKIQKAKQSKFWPQSVFLTENR